MQRTVEQVCDAERLNRRRWQSRASDVRLRLDGLPVSTAAPDGDDQRGHVAPFHRQRLDLFVRDDAADGRIARLDERRLTLDGQRLSELAELQRQP